MSTNEEEEYLGEWYPYEDGDTIDKLGPEEGYVLRDEEFGDSEEPEDAHLRLTLEQGRVENPGFFVSANLYGGWMYHVARRDTKDEGIALYDALKPELEKLVELFPYEGDKDIDGKVQRMNEATEEFQKRFA